MLGFTNARVDFIRARAGVNFRAKICENFYILYVGVVQADRWRGAIEIDSFRFGDADNESQSGSGS